MDNRNDFDYVPMTRIQLENYRSLIKEATDERIRLRFLEKEAERLGGDDSSQAKAYREAIKDNMNRCAVAASNVLDFISRIDNSRLRRVFTMYYIDGWSWQKIAFAIGSHCEATPRNMHNRYLAKMNMLK